MDANTVKLLGASLGAAVGFLIGKKYEPDEDSKTPYVAALAGAAAGYYVAPKVLPTSAKYNTSEKRREPENIAEIGAKLGQDGATPEPVLMQKQVVNGIVRFGPAPDERNSVGGF